MGNLALTVIILLPIFIPAIVVMLISSNAVIHWAAGLSLLLFLWIMRPTHHEINPALPREEAPALYAALDDLRARLGVGYEMQIILTDDFNAGALEMPGLLGSLGTRRTLYLGVPLLCALRPQEALGVIGHELGHFSRRHGLLGQRIYRTRQGWFSYTDADRHDSTLEQGAAAFARMFVPFFNSYTFVYGRRCEYEADADAASVVGSSTMAQALARTDVFNRIQEENFGAELARAQRESAEPPADFADRIIRSAARQEQTVLDHHLQLALAQKSDWLDTHPCLAERIAALGVEARLEPLAGPCAGEALLGEAWPAAKQKFSRE
jgi:Zn-dependent protease with chaperone function